MIFEFFVLLAIAATVINAGLLPQSYHQSHAAPSLTLYATKVIEPEYYNPHPHYNFAYNVHDSHTGDVKSQKESRDGDAVHGTYSLVEPDGTKRIVTYTADHHSGFNAIVSKQPLYLSIKSSAPSFQHAPALQHTSALQHISALHQAPTLQHVQTLSYVQAPQLSHQHALPSALLPTTHYEHQGPLSYYH